jgi:DNA-binding MarR family transcriptional regulator
MTLNREGPLSQRQLVSACGSERTTMVRSDDYLEQHQLASCGTHHSDRRAHTVTTTARGLEVLDAAHTNPGGCLDDVLTGFTYPVYPDPARAESDSGSFACVQGRGCCTITTVSAVETMAGVYVRHRVGAVADAGNDNT